MPGSRIAAVAAAAVVLVGAGTASAFELVPHRALYDVALAWAKASTGITAVDGMMAAELSESCEGWTVDHRSRFDISYAPETTVRITSEVATWESRDGLSYHFNVRNAINGETTETFEGRASLPAAGRPGRVKYTAPESKTEPLPAGTVFPTAHSLRIVAALARAPTFVSMIVFDGLSDDGAFEVGAAIGPAAAPAAAGTGTAKTVPGLEGRRSWPLQMAFFRFGGNEPLPEHEIGLRMFDNGVGDDMLLDFGDFKVRAGLVRLEIGKKPSCGA